MYNLWYLVFACIPILIIGVILLISSNFTTSIEKETTLTCSGGIITIITIAVLVILIGIAIILPLQAKKEYTIYISTQEMVEEIYNENSTLENAGLTNKIIELNNWLTRARASKETYGNWSMYYNLNLNELDYIRLNV